MSRYYEISVDISNFDDEKRHDIIEAAQNEWDFEDFECFVEERLFSANRGYLSGGESEEEFAACLTEAIWKANGKFCNVNVTATFLEELPYESYEFDEEDYQRFLDMGGGEE